MTIKAIQTEYNGYRFRSRLEARWAIYFDTLGTKYLYEYEGFDLGALGWYLPDFYFPDWSCWGEVKPTILTEEEYRKAASLPDTCILLDSEPRAAKAYYLTGGPHATEGEAYREYISGDQYGRIVLDQSQRKGRLWYLFGESIEDYYIDLSPELAALSARFEYGEAHAG